MNGVLNGIRVLDFGRYIAGPYCGALLSDLGAEVIRIEKVDGSEDRYQTPLKNTGQGGLFLQVNRNKLGFTLNPMKPAGREIVKKLVATADVVIANLPPQTRTAMGLDYDSLKAVKPDIILTTVSAFGEGGPYSERVGFDGIGQVMSGAVYLSGDEDKPHRIQAPYVDFGTATTAAFGTLAAIMQRQQTGEGQHVEGALVATALSFFNGQLIEQAVNVANRKPTGNRGPTNGPTDLFRTRDGWIIVQIVGNPLFKRWAELMGEEKWLTDPRFEIDVKRGENGKELSERMQQWCDQYTTAEALDILAEARIPAASVNKPQDTLDDPHVQQMGWMQPVEYPDLIKPAPVMKIPLRMSGTDLSIRHRAPTLGEHTEQILQELGYNAEQIEAFRADRVV